MKKFVFLLFFVCMAALTFAQGWRPGEMEVKVEIRSKTDALQIHNLGFSGDIYLKHAILYLTPEEIPALENNNLSYEIIIEDLNTYSRLFWQKDMAYHTYQEIIDLADSLAAHFPDICTKHVFGSSLGGRQCAALKISDNSATDENEAEVLFDGGIHGDEVGAAENVIRFARDLCLDYGNDPEITGLVDSREIWLYLMVNPDGRANDVRYNNNGVDLNRDWGYMWDEAGSSTGAFSQPESKALRACSYDNQFVVHTTYHSGTEYISCPWSYRPQTPHDMNHILQLAGIYSSQSGYANMGYGQGYSGMYAINGSTKDSNYGAMGSISWSMEISYDKHPPTSEIMMYYNYNKPSMLAMIEYSGYGLEGTVTDATTGDPVAASVFVDDFVPTFTDPVVGDYHKYVLAGTYDILVKANGYEDMLVQNVNVGSMTSTVTDIVLEPLDHQSIHRIISCQIPGNNHSDEGYTWTAIGQPDNLYYSIGKQGWVVVDMFDIVFDGAGPDIMVFEGDVSAEGYTVYAGESMDGPWHSMGDGSGTTEFDFQNCNISEARYFKIEDDGDGSATGNDIGFDLDAMQALSSVSGPYLVMDGVVIDDAAGNNNGLLDPGETADFTVTLKNVGTEDALAITGVFSSDDDYITILTTDPQVFGNIAIDASAEATFTVSAEDDVPAGYAATINFGFDGTNIAPATKYIQVPFPDYCYPSANCSYGDGFTGFQLEDINNMNSSCSNDNGIEGYGDFTDMLTDLEAGQTYEVGFQSGYSDQDVCLWIDLNADKLFDDDERLVTDFNLSSSGQTFTTTITIPEGVMPGEKRMRIRANWQNSAMDPCAGFSYGETEDYTVNITGDVLQAGFYAEETWICYGIEVQYHDNSTGDVTSWDWEFPGGSPASSSEQNPTVTYNSPGTYGVTLTVSNGTNQSTETMPEYMMVLDDPAVPDVPSGETEMCQDAPDCDYYTNPGNCTDWYWEIDPPSAGTILQNGPAITVDWSPEYAGEVQIMVAGINVCGQSSVSTPIDIMIDPMPEAAGEIDGLTDVCQGSADSYTTDEIAFAQAYEWVLEPAAAGEISANGEECVIAFSEDYLGETMLKVRGSNNCGDGDWSAEFLITVHDCSSIAENSIQTCVNVIPNPSNGIFEIELRDVVDDLIHVELCNASGEIVYQSEYHENGTKDYISINLHNHPAGVYYLKLSGNNTLITKKILINK